MPSHPCTPVLNYYNKRNSGLVKHSWKSIGLVGLVVLQCILLVFWMQATLFRIPPQRNILAVPSFEDMHVWQIKDHQYSGVNQNGHDYKPRGIVLCLHQGIFALGMSLIHELRCMGNTLPIEVHYCMDDELTPIMIQELQALDKVVTVDVCRRAASGYLVPDIISTFQSYWIKPLSVIFSSFEEVMLIDCDAIFMRDPAALFQIQGYQETGTIFFYDRLFDAGKFMNARNWWSYKTALHQMLALYSLAPFKQYTAIGDRALVAEYAPSDYFMKSYVWSGLSSHHQDSSLVVYNKKKQPRAMHVMLELIANLRFRVSFSWGDKEVFFLSTEMANSNYYFSPWGTSLISMNDDLKEHPNTLCGSAAHYWPENIHKQDQPDHVGKVGDEDGLFYVNGRQLVVYNKHEASLYRYFQFIVNPTHMVPRMKPRLFPTNEFSHVCFFEGGSVRLPQKFRDVLSRRRSVYNSWLLESNYRPHC